MIDRKPLMSDEPKIKVLAGKQKNHKWQEPRGVGETLDYLLRMLTRHCQYVGGLRNGRPDSKDAHETLFKYAGEICRVAEKKIAWEQWEMAKANAGKTKEEIKPAEEPIIKSFAAGQAIAPP